MESISAADTTPCPPRPCIRICTLLGVVQLICRLEDIEKTGVRNFPAVYWVLCPTPYPASQLITNVGCRPRR